MSECMTQEDAERMDASQAVQILKPLRTMMLDRYGCPISEVYFALGKAIEALEQPTVGAVQVVLCRECRHNKGEKVWRDGEVTIDCDNGMGYPPPNWFCADGERRSDGEQ